MKPDYALFIWHFLLVFCGHGDAVLVNKTIDDKFGDATTDHVISYSPVGVWNDGTNCQKCRARPDKDMLFNRTWMDSTFRGDKAPSSVPTASVIFNGTAVYVLCALDLSPAKEYSNSADMYFFINNNFVGAFSQEAPGTTGYEYNVSVFAIANLLPMEHNITIQNGHVGGPSSLMLLDVIIYTHDNGEPEPEPSSTPTISNPGSPSPQKSPLVVSTAVAIVLGAICAATLSGLAFLLYHRSRRLSNARRCTPYTYNPELRVPEAEAPPSYGVVPDNMSTPRWLRKTRRA